VKGSCANLDLRNCRVTQLAYRSSTVAANTIVPIIPIAPATTKGVCGAIFHSSPPIAAAGVIELVEDPAELGARLVTSHAQSRRVAPDPRLVAELREYLTAAAR